jgi:uncharacterized protein (DUF2236 family)
MSKPSPPDDIPLRALDALPFAGWVQSRLQATVLDLVSGGGAPRLDYAQPPGDPGLFGPGSVCWRVHADFTSMLVGGVAALMLQMLHPLALAGVLDHSDFRRDILGRLRRTATFVAGTTYASRQDAELLIARVRRVHRAVVGTAPDGRPYAADDPALLTWIHVAEVHCFLQGYLRYVDGGLSLADQDRYYDETALVAEQLGARDIPRSRASVAAYLEAMRPELAVSERTLMVSRLLLDAPAPSGSVQPFGKLYILAGIDLLPSWARRLHGFATLAPLRRPLVEAGVRSVAPLLRWAMREGAARNARRRVGLG